MSSEASVEANSVADDEKFTPKNIINDDDLEWRSAEFKEEVDLIVSFDDVKTINRL